MQGKVICEINAAGPVFRTAIFDEDDKVVGYEDELDQVECDTVIVAVSRAACPFKSWGAVHFHPHPEPVRMRAEDLGLSLNERKVRIASVRSRISCAALRCQTRSKAVCAV